MKYRILGRTGLKVSEIGMGLEHLLVKDEQTIIDTIKAAVGGGVNYLDCHVSHDFKEDSVEYDGYVKLGKAFKGIRDKLYISYITFYKQRSAEYTQPRFDFFLDALGTTHVEVFMIQFCDKNSDYDEIMGENSAYAHAKKMQAEGKVRFIGLSTHSTEIALKAIKSDKFDVLMFPINPAFDVLTDGKKYDTDKIETLWTAAEDFKADENECVVNKAGENKADDNETVDNKTGANNAGVNRLYKSQPRKNVYIECEKNNIGLVAMKIFAGAFIFGVEKEAGFTPVNLTSYALAQAGVSTVVPGCTTPEEINQILEYNKASDAERDYSEAVAKSRWSVTGNCIYCNHCMPCPVDINISQINKTIDSAGISIKSEKNKTLLVKASSCTQCGTCETRCPFDVKIIERMEKVSLILDEQDN